MIFILSRGGDPRGYKTGDLEGIDRYFSQRQILGVYDERSKARIAATVLRNAKPNANWEKDQSVPEEVDWWDDKGGHDFIVIQPYEVQ